MLVNTDTGTIDHNDIAVKSLGNCGKQPIPHTGFAPSHEPVVAGGMGTIAIRHISPGRTGVEAPENAVEDLAVVNPFYATHLVGEMRSDDLPFKIAQFIPTHQSLQKKP